MKGIPGEHKLLSSGWFLMGAACQQHRGATSSVTEIEQCISLPSWHSRQLHVYGSPRWKQSSLEDSCLIAPSNGRASVLDDAGNGSSSLTACIKKSGSVTKSSNDSFPSWTDYREACVTVSSARTLVIPI